MRERTYSAALPLQAGPAGHGYADAVLVDPLAGDAVALDPLYVAVRAAVTWIKVFHAARQDLEIFHVERRAGARALVRTLRSAMGLRLRHQVGYETPWCARSPARPLDKFLASSPDWSRPPVVGCAERPTRWPNVTHLRPDLRVISPPELGAHRPAHPFLAGRGIVLPGPMPGPMSCDPGEAWKRLKGCATNSGKTLPSPANWPPSARPMPQSEERPRNRVIKDDALMELASTKAEIGGRSPLAKVAPVAARCAQGRHRRGLVAAVRRGQEMPADQHPRPEQGRRPVRV